MTLSRTVIPAAYIFTDKIYDRYEQQYASTISEWMLVQNAMKKYTHTHAITFYLASIVARLDMTPMRKYMFIAYTPNEQRLNMAAFGDFDKLIVVVDSVAKKKRLQEFNRATTDLIHIARGYDEYLNRLNIAADKKYMQSLFGEKLLKNEFIKPSITQLAAFNKCRQILIDQFKREFCRSVSFAKRFSE